MARKTILSLFDQTGTWPIYYRYAGYRVVQIDLEDGIDIMEWDYRCLESVHGILAAPPCTHFSSSGAQYWEKKDEQGITATHLALVHQTMEIVEYFQPAWWCLENPVGRLKDLAPELGGIKHRFDPCDYGDPYTKKTCLYGEFSTPEPNPIEPIQACSQGSWLQLLGGNRPYVKRLRSMTPPGFAKAFWLANP